MMSRPSEVFNDVMSFMREVAYQIYSWLPYIFLVPMYFYPADTLAFGFFMLGMMLIVFKVVVWVELWRFREEEAARVQELMRKVREGDR